MTFEELEHKPHPHSRHGGTQAKVFFPNGYGASVIKTKFSYGREDGLYELGVLRGNEADHALTYETPITDDVLGYLAPEDVTRVLWEIEALPNAE